MDPALVELAGEFAQHGGHWAPRGRVGASTLGLISAKTARTRRPNPMGLRPQGRPGPCSHGHHRGMRARALTANDTLAPATHQRRGCPPTGPARTRSGATPASSPAALAAVDLARLVRRRPGVGETLVATCHPFTARGVTPTWGPLSPPPGLMSPPIWARCHPYLGPGDHPPRASSNHSMHNITSDPRCMRCVRFSTLG